MLGVLSAPADIDTFDLSQRQELLYAGMSRAKSLLVIVGRAVTCVQGCRESLMTTEVVFND